jgi:hypothetical protein
MSGHFPFSIQNDSQIGSPENASRRPVAHAHQALSRQPSHFSQRSHAQPIASVKPSFHYTLFDPNRVILV